MALGLPLLVLLLSFLAAGSLNGAAIITLYHVTKHDLNPQHTYCGPKIQNQYASYGKFLRNSANSYKMNSTNRNNLTPEREKYSEVLSGALIRH